MAIQPIRGNPEAKQVQLNMGFSGGMNITYSDDMLPTQMMRNIVNYDMESIGELSSRKGFGKNNALTEVIYPAGVYHNTSVNLSTQTEVFFTLLQNDNSSWQRLSDSEDYASFLSAFGATNTIRYLRLLVNTDKTLYWEDVTIALTATPTITKNHGTLASPLFTANANLFNWEYVDKYGRLYFTNNDKGLVVFDAEATDHSDPWMFMGDFMNGETDVNEAYKPNGIEVRKLGFNVLGTEPLSWVYESELTTETIQGVYITTTDRKPVKVLPAGTPFQVNILYTGDTYAFTLAMMEYETEIEITYAKNATYSTDGSLAVYDVTMKTQPSDEIELAINFDSETVTLDTYYDYYNVGAVPGDAEVVEQLNVGNFKITEIYDRLVYYHGNAIWFSEVDVYDYIPNFNYVLVPLDKTDEIVRIIFFRSSYIVFTKRRIYKLEGDFEATTFRLSLVNDNIGCISPNTPMVINNQMLFVSTQGLRALKTDTFRENLENIQEFDEAVRPLIIGTEVMYAVAYKDQYVLFGNRRETYQIISVNLREFRVPDVLRFYYKQGSFVSDIFANGAYPKFIFFENGEMYSLRVGGVYRYGDSYDDFGSPYDAILETPAINFGYPTHEKKIKHVILKAGGGSYDQPITLQVAADGQLVASSELTPSSIDDNGNIIYQDVDPVIGDSTPIENLFGDGISKYHTKKFRVSARGKNIALRILTTFGDRFSIQGIGYIYKLGKVRE